MVKSKGMLYSTIYIYTIYTLNLGLGISNFDQAREQGRFRGSTEGAKGSTIYKAVQGRAQAGRNLN